MRPQIIAHRGASHYAPENTLSAFRKAKEMGAYGIEMDIQQTKDKGLVIHHDYLIDLHTQASGMIYDMLEGDLRELDFGSWMGLEFSGEKIPTLAEALEVGKEFDVMHLEMKSSIDNDPDYAQRVAEAIVAAGVEDKVIVVAFEHGLLWQIKELLPGVRVGALTFGALESMLLPPSELERKLSQSARGRELLEELNGPQAMGRALQLAEDPALLQQELGDELDEENCGTLTRWISSQLNTLKAMYPGQSYLQILGHLMEQRDPAVYVQNLNFPLEWVSCKYQHCFSDPDLIRRLHAQGLRVALWTVDTEDALRALLKLEPDAIVSNRPDKIREWMGEYEAERQPAANAPEEAAGPPQG